LGIEIRAGRVYAGQAGATKWPSGKTSRATLRSRINQQHLNGRVRGSTFRLTLAAILQRELALTGVATKQLGLEGEQRLTLWLRAHLRLAVHPFIERDALLDLEHHVLTALDPPLNLDSRSATPIRRTLQALRTARFIE
jgi:hypothetical protein